MVRRGTGGAEAACAEVTVDTDRTRSRAIPWEKVPGRSGLADVAMTVVAFGMQVRERGGRWLLRPGSGHLGLLLRLIFSAAQSCSAQVFSDLCRNLYQRCEQSVQLRMFGYLFWPIPRNQVLALFGH